MNPCLQPHDHSLTPHDHLALEGSVFGCNVSSGDSSTTTLAQQRLNLRSSRWQPSDLPACWWSFCAVKKSARFSLTLCAMRSPSGSESRRFGVALQRRLARVRDDRGSATAELAVALPAIAVVLAVCVWGIQLAAVQVRLQDTAGLAARSAARGDDPLGAAGAHPGSTVSIWRDGELVCATATVAVAAPGGFPPVPVSADSCALLQQ